jgi:hypothetical protein
MKHMIASQIEHPRLSVLQILKSGHRDSRILTTFLIIALFYLQGIAERFGVTFTLVIGYVITFSSFLIIYMLYNSNHFKIERWFLFSIFYALFSCLIGFYYGWYPRDILADVARFIAPFLGFATGFYVLKNFSKERIFYLISLFFGINLLFFIKSLIEKIYFTYQGETLVGYQARGIGSSTFLMLFLTMLLIKGQIKSKLWKLFIIVYFLIWLISPIFSLSRTSMLSSVFVLMLIFLYGLNRRQKVLLLLFSGITLSLFYPVLNNISTDRYLYRFTRMFDAIKSGDLSRTSTGVRILEIKKSMVGISQNLPSSIFWGLGSGALWFDDSGDVRKSNALAPQNFRENGGAHHIHSTYFSIFFRYGFIGLALTLGWIVSVLAKMKISSMKSPYPRYSVYHIWLLTLKLACFSSLFVSLFNYSFYGNCAFGFFLAIGFVLSKRLQEPIFISNS